MALLIEATRADRALRSRRARSVTDTDVEEFIGWELARKVSDL
jgi:hypothetical protein